MGRPAGRVGAVGADTKLFWLDVDREEHLRRLRDRAAPRDVERIAGFDLWWAAQNRTVPTYAVRLRANLPVATMVTLATMHRAPLTAAG